MFTLASSNECFLSVAFITASSTIHINVVVATRPARLIVWLLLPSLPIAINNGIATIKLAEVLLRANIARGGRGANQTPHHTQQSNRYDGEPVAPPVGEEDDILSLPAAAPQYKSG